MRGSPSIAPCSDPRRAGQRTRLRLAEQISLQDRRAKAAERARKYRERKRAPLQNNLHPIVENTITLVTIDQATSRAATEWALRWFHETSSRGVEFQKALIPKFLKHPI